MRESIKAIMAMTHKSTATADLSIGNASKDTCTQQYKETDQAPTHDDSSTRTPLYNAFPTALRSTSPNPSSAAFQHLIADSEEHNFKLDLPSWPKSATHTTPDLKPLGSRQIETAGIHRRLCFSLDEKALFDLHKHHQYSSTSNSQQRSSGPSDQEPQRSAPEPIAPPYAPPKRTRTPDGVPSWPGLLPPNQQQQWNARQQQQQKRNGNFMRRSSRRLARFFADILDGRPTRRNAKKPRVRHIFGLKRYREEPPRHVALWRPPISGHSTYRFESLDAHPFLGPSLSDEPYVGGPLNGFRRSRRKIFSSELLESRRSGSEDPFGLVHAQGIRAQLQRRQEVVPPADSRLRRRAMSRPSRSSGSDNSVIISPSVRALAAVRGLPLPVSPEQVEAEARRRSSSIPRSRVCSPVNRLGSTQRRFSYPTNTMRTVDLIEAFPEPPCSRTPRSSQSAPARMSLFPAVAGLKERSGNVQSTLSPSKKRLEMLESVVESAKKRKRASASSSGPLQAPLTRVDSAVSPSASNVWVSGALPAPSERDGSADMTACNSPPLRGEDVDRYRPSGTPVYDRNTTSLCSVDETEDVDITVLVTRLDTPVSGKTGITRYFSAASQAVSSPNVPATAPSSIIPEPQRRQRSEHQIQRERAVANGALRFSFQASDEDTGFRGSPLCRQVAAVPVRTSSLTKTCSHRASAIRGRRSVGWESFDGTQDLPDGSAMKSGRVVYCFRCEVKRGVRRMARLVRGRDLTRRRVEEETSSPT
jgi:hypothetical protein